MNKQLISGSTFANWLRTFAMACVLVLAPALALSKGGPAPHSPPKPPPHAKPHHVAPDLGSVVHGAPPHGARWVRDTPSGRLLQVIIVADTRDDRKLNALRAAILKAGGSVHRRFDSMGTISALLPASAVAAIAARPDVISVTPNRPVIQTASLLDTQVGAADVRTMVGVAPQLDGTGVTIAVLDSGIMSAHKAFLGTDGRSRILARQDLTLAALDWSLGVDTSGSLGGLAGGGLDDPYGHGTLVASIAGGADVTGSTDSAGVAPGASLVDVRVLGADGTGDLATTLAGIDWVISNASNYNIRVLNVSLGADSTDSFIDDPLCAAVRRAVAAGITVVVAAGNYGVALDGATQLYGTISSPGNEPSVITVGSVNAHDSAMRDDDSINFFSSKGPTRGTYVDDSGVTQHDDLIKPDVVAPGNRVLGAMSQSTSGGTLSTMAANNLFSIVQRSPANSGLMQGSGTSFAAPVVSGAVALLLQANPGLTPTAIKAILQYSAQPLPLTNIVQQGAGELNIPGAVTLAQAVSPALASRVAAGTISVGDSILAAGATVPAPWSIINGTRVDWARFVTMGGSHILTGDALFTSYQAVYDPELLWVDGVVYATTPNFNPNGSVAGYSTNVLTTGAVLSDGVVSLDGLLGASDPTLHTGLFTYSSGVTAQVLSGVGDLLSGGVVISNGITYAEGITFAEGLTFAEGITFSEGLTFAEGITFGEGLAYAEGVNVRPGTPGMAGEP